MTFVGDQSSVVLATDRSLCFEDIGAAPIWVFNNGSLVTFCLYSTSIDVVVLYKCFNLYAGISHKMKLKPPVFMPFVQGCLCVSV